MADSVYRVTEVIGVSSESWEAAARSAVETAGGSIRDLRVAEVLRQDVTIEDGNITDDARIRAALPTLKELREISLAIATSVATQAYRMNLTRRKRPANVRRSVQALMYRP